MIKQILSNLGAILLLLGILSFLFSCSDEELNHSIRKSNDFKLVSLEPKSKVDFSDFAKNIQYIVLQTKPNFYIPKIDKIEIYNDRIFILSEIQKSIFIFKKSGEIVGKISDFGDGPGKYSGISDFVINNGFIYLLTSPSQYLYKYDLEGKLLEVIPTNNNYIYEIAPIKTGWMAHLKDAFDSENNYNLVRWDSLFSERLDEFLFIDPEKRNNSLIVDNYISKVNDDLWIIENFSNRVYKFSTDSLQLVYEILIDKEGIEKEFVKNFIASPDQAINRSIKENIFTGFKKIISTKEILFIESMKGPGTVSSFISIISGNSIAYNRVDFKFEYGIAGNVIATDGQRFVMEISQDIFNKLKDLEIKGDINEKSLKNEELRKAISLYEKEGNPVLVFFDVNFD